MQRSQPGGHDRLSEFVPRMVQLALEWLGKDDAVHVVQQTQDAIRLDQSAADLADEEFEQFVFRTLSHHCCWHVLRKYLDAMLRLAWRGLRDADGPDDVVADLCADLVEKRFVETAVPGRHRSFLLSATQRRVAEALRRRYLAQRGFVEVQRRYGYTAEGCGNDLRRVWPLLLDVIGQADMDEQSRQILQLAYGCGLANRQIADILGLDPKAVGLRKHRASKRIRSELATRLRGFRD